MVVPLALGYLQLLDQLPQDDVHLRLAPQVGLSERAHQVVERHVPFEATLAEGVTTGGRDGVLEQFQADGTHQVVSDQDGGAGERR